MTGLLLLTSLLARAPQPSTVAAPVSDVRGVTTEAASQAQTTPNDGGPSTPSEPVHQVGIGATMGMSGRGAGMGFRYFFGKRLGFNTTFAWYRPAVASASQSGSLLVAPSAVYMLTKPPQGTGAVSVRPYVGGGLNFATGSTRVVTGVTTSVRASGLGAQAFAGVEFAFRDANGLAISAEVAHYQLAVSPVSSALGQATNFYVLVHYYMR